LNRQSKFFGDVDRGIVGSGQSPGELGPGCQLNSVCQSPDDFAEHPDLVVSIPAGYQKIGRMPQRSKAALSRS
jgi:hypothetical protein